MAFSGLGARDQIKYILRGIIKELIVEVSLERNSPVLKVYIPKEAILDAVRNIPVEITAGLKENISKINAGDYEYVEVFIGNDYKFEAEMKYESRSRSTPIGYKIVGSNGTK